MLNKKATSSFASMIVWITIVMAIAYVMDFGGFKDIVDTTFGNTTAVSAAPTVSINAKDGLSQHIAEDNAAHNTYDNSSPTNVEGWNEPNNAQQPEQENTNIEPSFFENNGLSIILFIFGGLILGYSIYKYKKTKGGVKNEKKLFKKSFNTK